MANELPDDHDRGSGDPGVDPADPAASADPADPVDPADPADPSVDRAASVDPADPSLDPADRPDQVPPDRPGETPGEIDDAGPDADPPEPSAAVLATLCFTFFSVGVTVAAALAERDVGVLTAMVVAVTAYSATSELAFLSVREAGGSVTAAVASAWLVATRFGVLTATLGGRLSGGPGPRLLGAWLTVDPNVGLMIQYRDRARARRVYWRTTAALAVGWIAGNAVGITLGDVLGDADRWGLDVVFPAALLATIRPLLATQVGLVTGVGSAVLCVALITFVPAGLPILLSAFVAVAVVLARRARGRNRPTPDDPGVETATTDGHAVEGGGR
ncbi:MAG: AzlC family ABC transporter permease [Actinomycetota bacterium]